GVSSVAALEERAVIGGQDNPEGTFKASDVRVTRKRLLIVDMLQEGFNRHVLRLTSKMSHDRSRRGSCVSRRRDGCGRWLWRLVGLLGNLPFLSVLAILPDNAAPIRKPTREQ